MNHLINENEITFDLISESDFAALSASKIMLRDRFGGFLHIEATQPSMVAELYVLNKDCPPPYHFFLHYGVILVNSFAIGSIYPRTYDYMLIHAMQYNDKLKYQLFFTNSLDSAKHKASIMDGFVTTTKFKSVSTNTSSFKWLEVLKRHIGKNVSSKPSEAAISFIKAVKEFYAAVNDKNPERLGANTERAMFATLEEFHFSLNSTPGFTDKSFIAFIEKFVERATIYSDSETV